MDAIRNAIRDVPDFPKPGIVFKDITPLLLDPNLGQLIISEFCEKLKFIPVDVIVGVESRGFLFGYTLAAKLQVPFVPVRKSGKLPWKTIAADYELEYGTARVEMHEDALRPGARVLVHDDLLATGGTATAAAKLVQMQQAIVSAFAFVVELDFLKGRDVLKKYAENIVSLVNYKG